MQNVSGKWLENDNIIKVDSSVTRIAEIIDMRCSGRPDIAKAQRGDFLRSFDCRFQLVRIALEMQLTTIFKADRDSEIVRIYQTCSVLKQSKSIFKNMVIHYDITSRGRKILNELLQEFGDATRNFMSASRDSEAPLRKLDPCEKVSVEHMARGAASKQFVCAVSRLYSRYVIMASTNNDDEIRTTLTELFSRLVNVSFGEGQPSVTEALAYHINMVMRGDVQLPSQADLEDLLQKITKLLSHSQTQNERDF